MLKYREALKARLRESLVESGVIAQVRLDNTPAMNNLADAMERKNEHVLRLLTLLDEEQAAEIEAIRVKAAAHVSANPSPKSLFLLG